MTSDILFERLEACAKTTSKKAKLEIVRTLGDYKPWLQAALDPTVAYYVAKLPKEFPKCGPDFLGEHDLELLRKLSERVISGKEALQRISDHMCDLTPMSQEVFRRVILKDLRCGVGATIVNDAFPGLIPVFPYQRCVLEKDSNMAKWNWGEGIIVQLKADGMFANANIEGPNDVRLFSRQGSPFPQGVLKSLERQLGAMEKGWQVHGELLVHGPEGEILPRQEGNGILNSLLSGGELPAGHDVSFDVWDMIPLSCAVDKGKYDVPYADRLRRLRQEVDNATDGLLAVIASDVVTSRAGAMEIYRKYLKQGLEGVICKHLFAKWRDGDNKDQVKLKQEVDVDLEVEAVLPGNADTRLEGRPGRFAMKTSDGLLKVNVTIKNEKMRDLIEEAPDLFIGKIFAVRANGVMQPGENNELHSLFLPRFVEDQPRTDKVTADNLAMVQDQFEAAVTA